jgi:hypothetical protein
MPYRHRLAVHPSEGEGVTYHGVLTADGPYIAGNRVFLAANGQRYQLLMDAALKAEISPWVGRKVPVSVEGYEEMPRDTSPHGLRVERIALRGEA